MTEKKKPRKKPRPLPPPDPPREDAERRERNLDEIRRLMGMNTSALT